MKNKSIYLILGTLIIFNIGLQFPSGLSRSLPLFQALAPITIALNLSFALIHGTMRYGKKNMLIFFLITFIISWSYENLSIVSGFPFGHYHYTDYLGLKLLYVPLAIMPAYFGTAYLSWTLAQILLDEFNNKLSRGSVFFVPLIASFIMVMWDLVFDPAASTILQAWVWEEGGGFFGVPLSNFLGWFLCVFTIYQIFAIYLAKKEAYRSHPIVIEKLYWIQAAVMYVLLSSSNLLRILTPINVSVTSLDNHQWWISDITMTSVLMWIFTMFFVASLAIIKTSRNEKLLSVFTPTP